MDMLTIKADDESRHCHMCQGPIVRPFPCQHGCSEFPEGKLAITVDMLPEYDEQLRAVMSDLIMYGVGLPAVRFYGPSIVDSIKPEDFFKRPNE